MTSLSRIPLIIIRRFIFICETVLAYPASIIFIMIGRVCILSNRYAEGSVFVSKVPFYFGEKVRYLYYKATLQQLGKDVTFKYGSFCHYRNISIGDRVLIGYYNALGLVNIGDDVLAGCFVIFTSGLNHHSFEDPATPIAKQPAKGPTAINIGNDVWIGNNAQICADVGNRCVIGAGSVVVKPVENFSVYAGNPARLIKKIE